MGKELWTIIQLLNRQQMKYLRQMAPEKVHPLIIFLLPFVWPGAEWQRNQVTIISQVKSHRSLTKGRSKASASGGGWVRKEEVRTKSNQNIQLCTDKKSCLGIGSFLRLLLRLLVFSHLSLFGINASVSSFGAAQAMINEISFCNMETQLKLTINHRHSPLYRRHLFLLPNANILLCLALILLLACWLAVLNRK